MQKKKKQATVKKNKTKKDDILFGKLLKISCVDFQVTFDHMLLSTCSHFPASLVHLFNGGFVMESGILHLSCSQMPELVLLSICV